MLSFNGGVVVLKDTNACKIPDSEQLFVTLINHRIQSVHFLAILFSISVTPCYSFTYCVNSTRI